MATPQRRRNGKRGAKRVVIRKDLPVLQCRSRREYLIEDAVMARMNTMLTEVDERAELEIMSYTA